MPRILVVIAAFVLSGCWSQTTRIELQGETMGTTFSIVAIDRTGAMDPAAVRTAVELTLKEVNAAMSNWDPESEVSRFNDSGTHPVAISPELAEIMQTANAVHVASQGAFDVTLGPLIALWGFGHDTPDGRVPDLEDIKQAQSIIGQSDVLKLTRMPDTLQKSDERVSVHLAAIAKGYGIDRIAGTLQDLGLRDYMVEIGGDLVTAGLNDRDTFWRIGIERPDPTDKRVEDVIPISDQGMATSGDYRNYFEQDGVRYAHILDATTGHPITHTTASVTVLADSAMLADAWATALLALGAERGLPVAEKNNLAVFFIVRDTRILETSFSTIASSRFEEVLARERE
ncbi:MAG: FAD:protein FMN transferase [Pseudomonadota bacterium]